MKYKIGKSKIDGAGKGLIVKKPYRAGEMIGLAHVDDQPVTSIGKFHNHSEEPTAGSIKIDNRRYIVAMRDLEPGDEITTDYRQQPELEQPEDFKKGGTLKLPKMPKPSKKGVLGKGYSRSLEATNKLFTENNLFAKPKSRKRKVFDPGANYAEGGALPQAEYGMPLGTGRSQNYQGRTKSFYAKGGALLTKEVTCKKCGWKWDAADGGDDITTCHKCGGQGLVHAQKGGAASPEKWSQEIRNIESQIGNPDNWTLEDYYLLQDKLNNYKNWRETTPEGQAVRDSHNVEGEYNVPLPQHLQDYTDGMMKAKLAYANEFGNPAAKRMIVAPDQPYDFGDGNYGTHYMASMDNYAVPQIQEENGQLNFGDYDPSSKEAMQFDNSNDARYFAENYKKASPAFIEAKLTPKEIEEYRRGGWIVEEY